MESPRTTTYRVQHLVDNNASFPFHRSIQATWAEKWRFLAHKGLYPFADGNGDDFEHVFGRLIKENDNDPAVFNRPEVYVQPFLDLAAELFVQAETAEKNKDFETAKSLWLRSACLCRIGRFPIPRSPGTRKAWDKGLEAFMRASPYLDPPNAQVEIPHVYASMAAGESTDDIIRAFLRVPKGEAPEGGWPLILFICGLDAYRTDQSSSPGGKLHHGLSSGQAFLIVDIPGTADSPCSRSDPESPDRLWSSVLDWLDANASTYKLDNTRIAVRGISTGGYYAMRIAHTHGHRLRGVVSQGGGSHHMFDAGWIRAMNHMEYPFALADAIAYKFGAESVEEFVASEPRKRYSLLESGIFDRDESMTTRLLLVNGLDDSIFPIEDSLLPFSHGRVKEARFVEGRGHMGAPESEPFLNKWLDEVLSIK